MTIAEREALNPEPPPKEDLSPTGRPIERVAVSHYWYLGDSREERWRDFEGIKEDNGVPKPRIRDVKRWKHGRRPKQLPKVDRVRLADMERLMWEDRMANEIAKRAGEAPLVEWKPGGTFDWTPDLDQALLEHVANGGTYTGFARRIGCSRTAVVARAQQEDIAEQIEVAKAQGFDAMAEMALEVASTPYVTEQTVELVDALGNTREKHIKTFDAVDVRKLVFQSHMQMLSKLAPNKYGEKPEAPQSDTMAQQILKARARVREAND